jgi:hypothetical protein
MPVHRCSEYGRSGFTNSKGLISVCSKLCATLPRKIDAVLFRPHGHASRVQLFSLLPHQCHTNATPPHVPPGIAARMPPVKLRVSPTQQWSFSVPGGTIESTPLLHYQEPIIRLSRRRWRDGDDGESSPGSRHVVTTVSDEVFSDNITLSFEESLRLSFWGGDLFCVRLISAVAGW